MSGEPKAALWSALLAACGIQPGEVNDFNRPRYQEAARALHAAGATPQEIARRAEAMRRQYTVPVTPRFLAAHYGEHAPARSAPAIASGLFWHPDRCPTPCIGCAADRKADCG